MTVKINGLVLKPTPSHKTIEAMKSVAKLVQVLPLAEWYKWLRNYWRLFPWNEDNFLSRLVDALCNLFFKVFTRASYKLCDDES